MIFVFLRIMKKLLSLPPDAAGCFHKLTGYDAEEWFTTSDPAGIKLGSGGGTTWALDEWIRCGGDMSQKRCSYMPAVRAAACRLMLLVAKFLRRYLFSLAGRSASQSVSA